MEQTTLHFPLNLTIDQTETGYRAVFISHPSEEIEAPTVADLLQILNARIAELEEDNYDLKTVERAFEDIAVNKTVPWEQLKADLGL